MKWGNVGWYCGSILRNIIFDSKLFDQLSSLFAYGALGASVEEESSTWVVEAICIYHVHTSLG